MSDLAEAPNVGWWAMGLSRFDFGCKTMRRDIETLVYLFSIFLEAESQVKVADLELERGCQPSRGAVFFAVDWAIGLG